MKLMFIHGGTKLKEDTSGNLYTDGNFNNKIWDRYCTFCDNLQVLLRKETKIYDNDYAINKFNRLDKDKVECISMPEIYAPVKNYFNWGIRKKIKSIIESSVKQCDYVIIRSPSNYYCIQAIKMAKRYDKPYLIEVTGIAWDANWYHSIKGKIVAFYSEMCVKHYVSQAPFAVYVTKEVIQKRYPCKGKILGCSDVELEIVGEDNFQRRLEKINELFKTNRVIVLGTAAGVNFRTKGQQCVIKALSILKRQGIKNIEYQIVGGGNFNRLYNVAKKYDVKNQIKFLGSKPHEDVFKWMDNIDIYIQPSFQEGLCRAIVEAMSRACPIIASDAGGNKELINQQYIFKRGKSNEIAKKIIEMLNMNNIIDEATKNFDKAHDYNKNVLDKKRTEFYNLFFMKKIL